MIIEDKKQNLKLRAEISTFMRYQRRGLLEINRF